MPSCSFSCVYELCDFKLRSFGIGMCQKNLHKNCRNYSDNIFYFLLVFLSGYCYLQNGKLKGNAKMGIWDFLNLLGSRGSFATQKSWIFDYWRHWQVKKNGIVQEHHNSCYIPSTSTNKYIIHIVQHSGNLLINEKMCVQPVINRSMQEVWDCPRDFSIMSQRGC